MMAQLLDMPGTLLAPEDLVNLMDLAGNTPGGCFVEVGVYKGGSAWYLARVAMSQRRAIYLYDTFEGMPHQGEHDPHAVGDFSDTSYAQVCSDIPYANVVKGVFPDSMVRMPPIAFAHVDADQYASVKACCDHLGPMMVAGGIMVFDDYHHLEGATRAVDETGWKIEFTSTNKAFTRFV